MKHYSIELTYKNNDKVAHCILLYDYNGHPWRDTLRIIDGLGNVIPYIGRRAGSVGASVNVNVGHDNEVSSAFFIVPSGMLVKTVFELSENYDIKDEKKYNIRYSLPVTPCKNINNGLVEVPSSYDPFLIEPRYARYKDWDFQLDTIRKHRSEWAKVGFFAELDTFVMKTKMEP